MRLPYNRTTTTINKQPKKPNRDQTKIHHHQNTTVLQYNYVTPAPFPRLLFYSKKTGVPSLIKVKGVSNRVKETTL